MRNRYSSKKKLGVLVSSLALVAVTAMAGVTGTAAWFTANRAKTVTAGTFTAYSPSDSLTIKADALQGTYATGNDSNVSVKDGAGGTENYLRDASFDASVAGTDPNAKKAVGTLYRANVDDSDNSAASATVNSYSVVNANDYDTGSSVKVGSETHKVYYAVSWTYKFTCANPNANGSALFFDPANSQFGGSTATISKGFRIAMNNYTAFGSGATVKDNGYLVWANDAVTTYVNGTAKENTSNISDNHFVQPDTSYGKKDDGISAGDATIEKTYLGTFKKAADGSENYITVTCTAWYEGNDPAVITKNVSSSEAITAKMTFYVRDLAKPTTPNPGK